jgi:dinuclear metal center YbgI/SA1388 family protein
MTTTVAEILARIGTRFPLSKAAAWDTPLGLQFGDPVAPVQRLAVCHEITEAVTAVVERDPVDLIVTYHPLLFGPTERLVAGPTASGRAFRLIRQGVAVAAVHTAFDVAPGGAADALAAALGLDDVRGFGPLWGPIGAKITVFVPEAAAETVAVAMADAGAGEIGAYGACSFRTSGTATFRPGEGATPVMGERGRLNHQPEVRIEMVAPAGRVDRVVAALLAVHPYEEPAYDVWDARGNAGLLGRIGTLPATTTVEKLGQLVRECLGGVVRIAGTGPVRTVGVIPGSGGSFLAAAAAAGADVVVTGDVSHHAAQRALGGEIALVDPGHIATERPGVAALYAEASTIVAAEDLTGLDPDPWKEP